MLTNERSLAEKVEQIQAEVDQIRKTLDTTATTLVWKKSGDSVDPSLLESPIYLVHAEGPVEFINPEPLGQVTNVSPDPLHLPPQPVGVWKTYHNPQDPDNHLLHCQMHAELEREIEDQTIHAPQNFLPFLHGEIRTIEKKGPYKSYVMTEDRGRVTLPQTVVAHDCPDRGSRFVTDGGTCPHCQYMAYGKEISTFAGHIWYSSPQWDQEQENTEDRKIECDSGPVEPPCNCPSPAMHLTDCEWKKWKENK